MSKIHFEYIDISDTNTGWDNNAGKDYGHVPGLVRGFNIEFQHKDTGEITYGSCVWESGNIEDYFQKQVDDWGYLGFVLFEAEKSKGYEPTGRAVFRGYGQEKYDPNERDYYIENVNINEWLQYAELTPKEKIDRHASIYDNTIPLEKKLDSQKDNIEVEGKRGTWYVIDETEINGRRLFLLEHEEYGDEAACVIVDEDGKLIMDEIWNGFDDYEEESPKNEYYKFSDGWFTYFVNTETGEKKFALDPGDVLVEARQDDFSRENYSGFEL